MSPLAPEKGSKTAMRDKGAPLQENGAGALPESRVKHSVGEARFRPC
jgi:hypothetical protein